MLKICIGHRHERHNAERYEGPVKNVAWGVPQEILGVFGWVKSRGPHPVDTRFRGGGHFCSQLYLYIVRIPRRKNPNFFCRPKLHTVQDTIIKLHLA